ncbi:MAG: alpha/beta hydrolase [Pseudomonadota bacterium]
MEDVPIYAVERPAKGRARSGAPVVILIHGAGVDHRDWTFSFLDRLNPTWRVLAFDRPGFGGSGRSAGPASALPTTQARLLQKAAMAHDVERALVVGHSWGGAVGMAWGVSAPESTVGVASLAGAVAPWSLANAIKNGRRMQSTARTALGAGGMRAAAMEALAASFEPEPMPSGYADHLETDLRPLSGPAAATMADVSTINGALALLTPRYAAFERPVELVYGDADTILSIDEQGRAAAAMLPNARLTALPGAGHMLHHTKPRACLAAIERLFAAGCSSG